MPQEPHIKGLSDSRRRWLFRLLLLIFVISLPAVIFYTTGYRISFEDDSTSIVTTGGVYIDTDSTDVQVFLNEEQFMRPRLFQSAYYLQNIEAGQQRVVVQAEGVHTWVKELPVDPHIVIEASAFNVPLVTRVRPITPYETAAGLAVYQMATTTNATSTIFGQATSTLPFQIVTSQATSTYEINPEYAFVAELFASSSTSTISVFEDNAPKPSFGFATSVISEAVATTSSTTSEPVFVERNNIRLVDRGWEVYAQWVGRNQQSIPYYFCVSSSSPASTSARYGQHVSDAIFSMLGTTTATSTVFSLDNQYCRTEIKLDHLRQDVYLYEFLPDSSNRVLLHLENGLYVTEIDDRAWQNTQPLIEAPNLRVIVENDVIYIERNGYFFEVVPELAV